MKKKSPEERGQEFLDSMIRVTGESVKGAHDSSLVVTDKKAYIVYMANDRQPGENSRWPYIYTAMSIVDIASNRLLDSREVAHGGQQFANVRLKEGSCFVPRILQKEERTLRIFFDSMDPDNRPTEVWYRDYDLQSGKFDASIGRVNMETPEGTVPLSPQAFHEQARRQGFSKPVNNDGPYLFDIGKEFDGKLYVAVNNFGGKQNALCEFNEDLTSVRVIGNINEPLSEDLSEAAVERMPDGRWVAILRNDGNNLNYRFAYSDDGVCWTAAEESPLVQNGSNSKPVLHCFDGVYCLGWQEKPYRTRFNLEVSTDFVHWKRAYSFHDEDFSLQYPSMYAYDGEVYLCATHCFPGEERERRDSIYFGHLNSVSGLRELCR